MKTFIPKKPVNRSWFVIDATGKPVGRVAVKIANLLRGKTKTVYTPQVDVGDFVIVINAEKVRFTGKKETQKIYQRYSGYRSGLQLIPAFVQRERHPERIIEQAVKRMLPKNNTTRKVLTRLRIFAGAKHSHAAQNPKIIE